MVRGEGEVYESSSRDLKIRKLIKKEFYQAAISKIELERAASERVRIIINAARPGDDNREEGDRR